MDKFRKNARFFDFGRIDCERICSFPAELKDISLTGMKVEFNSDIELNMNDEYEVTVRLSKFNGEPITLLVLPMWRFDNKSSNETEIQVGFSILPSLDYAKLSEYISKMDENDVLPEPSLSEISVDEESVNDSVKLVVENLEDYFKDELDYKDDNQCQFL